MKHFLRLRVMPAIIHLTFQSMALGNIELRRVSEEVVAHLEAGPDATEMRPLLFSLMGQQQARHAAKIQQQKQTIGELTERVDELKAVVEKQQKAIEELFDLLTNSHKSSRVVMSLKLDEINKGKRSSEPSPRKTPPSGGSDDSSSAKRRRKKTGGSQSGEHTSAVNANSATGSAPANESAPAPISPTQKKKHRNSAPDGKRKRSSTIIGHTTSPPQNSDHPHAHAHSIVHHKENPYNSGTESDDPSATKLVSSKKAPSSPSLAITGRSKINIDTRSSSLGDHVSSTRVSRSHTLIGSPESAAAAAATRGQQGNLNTDEELEAPSSPRRKRLLNFSLAKGDEVSGPNSSSSSSSPTQPPSPTSQTSALATNSATSTVASSTSSTERSTARRRRSHKKDKNLPK